MTPLEIINNALEKQLQPWIYLRREQVEAIKSELENKTIKTLCDEGIVR